MSLSPPVPVDALDGDVELAPLTSRAVIPFLVRPLHSGPDATPRMADTGPLHPDVEAEGVIHPDIGPEVPTVGEPAPIMPVIDVENVASLAIADGVGLDLAPLLTGVERVLVKSRRIILVLDQMSSWASGIGVKESVVLRLLVVELADRVPVVGEVLDHG